MTQPVIIGDATLYCGHCARPISDYARQEFPNVVALGFCCVKCQWGMTPAHVRVRSHKVSGKWGSDVMWSVVLPDGWLLECGLSNTGKERAAGLAEKINAGSCR